MNSESFDPHPTETEVADNLRKELDRYTPEIAKLFGQVLSLYAGPTANTMDNNQKRESLRQKLEQSVPL